MKPAIFIFSVFLFCQPAKAQSPYLNMLVTMDSSSIGPVRYSIEMKICEPKKRTDRGSWFSHDTSAIDFGKLTAAVINCGQYMQKGEPDRISGGNNDPVPNKFTFSNQVFAWEKIFVFRIANMSSRGWTPDMYVVMPMPYKSFVTLVVVKDIQFQSGKVVFLDKLNGEYRESALTIERSLKGIKGVNPDKLLMSGIL
jgi:hypothetical protein